MTRNDTYLDEGQRKERWANEILFLDNSNKQSQGHILFEVVQLDRW